MVLPGIPYLSAAEVTSIHGEIGRAFGTLRAIQDPQPVVTIRRRVGGTPTDVLVDVGLIGVWVDNRDEQEVGANEGRASTQVVGEVMAFAPFVVEIGDWFIWDGFRCVITSVEPESLGTVTARFRLEEGVR